MTLYVKQNEQCFFFTSGLRVWIKGIQSLIMIIQDPNHGVEPRWKWVDV